jgi:hypothetical protein
MSRWEFALPTGRSSFPAAVGRFGPVLSTPGAVRFFVPAAVARLGVAMSGLAVLWAVHAASGSFGRAGAAAGAFAVADAVVALVLVPAAVVLQNATERDVYTQAMVWVNSASAMGIATAAPLVGYLIQRHDWPTGFLALAALTASLPVILLIASPILSQP